MFRDQTTTEKEDVLGHQIPLQEWQLPSLELQASPGKQVASV
jgi:hypothetical protein